MDNKYNCDELLSGFLLNLPKNNYDAVEELCKRYGALKPKLQPYYPNFDYLLRCFVSLSEVLEDYGLSVPEPPLSGNMDSDMATIDKYFKDAAAETARLRTGDRVAKLRHEIHWAYRQASGKE